jgi:hypothetical protein
VLREYPVCRPGNERPSPQPAAHSFPPSFDINSLGVLPVLLGAPYEIAATDTPSQDQECAVPTPRHPVEQEHRCDKYETANHKKPVAEPAKEVCGLTCLRSHDRGPADDQGDRYRDSLPAACPGEVHSGPVRAASLIRFESSRRHHHLRLAVQQALPLLPLFLGPTHASPLRDGVDDADEGGEDHGRESDEGQGHRREGRGVEFMTASYRTG